MASDILQQLLSILLAPRGVRNRAVREDRLFGLGHGAKGGMEKVLGKIDINFY